MSNGQLTIYDTTLRDGAQGEGVHFSLSDKLRLAEKLAVPVEPVETVGWNGDLLEAQCFAFLAVRVARGWPTSCPATTGVPVAMGGGVLSAPGPAG